MTRHIHFSLSALIFLSLDLQEQLLEVLQSLPQSKYMLIGSVGSDPITLIAEKKLSKSLYYFFRDHGYYNPQFNRPKRRYSAVC